MAAQWAGMGAMPGTPIHSFREALEEVDGHFAKAQKWSIVEHSSTTALQIAAAGDLLAAAAARPAGRDVGHSKRRRRAGRDVWVIASAKSLRLGRLAL